MFLLTICLFARPILLPIQFEKFQIITKYFIIYLYVRYENGLGISTSWGNYVATTVDGKTLQNPFMKPKINNFTPQVNTN